MEKEIKKINSLMGKPTETRDRTRPVRSGKVIDIQKGNRQIPEELRFRPGSKSTQVTKGLGVPGAKIDFLNEQLGNAKNELLLFRQNHNALVEQIVFVQKDFKRRLRNAASDKRTSDENLKKASTALKLKEKDLFANEKRLQELRAKFGELHLTYSEKLKRFKKQHKDRIEDRETAAVKKQKVSAIDRERLEKSVNYLMDIVHQRTERVTVVEEELVGLKKESLNLIKVNEDLNTYKREHVFTVEGVHKELKKVKIELGSIGRDYKTKEKEVDVLKNKIFSLSEDSDDYLTKIETLNKSVVGLRTELSASNYRLEAHEQTISDLRQENLTGSKLVNEIKDHQASKEGLKKDYQDLKAKHEKSLARIMVQEQELLEFRGKVGLSKTELTMIKTNYEKSQIDFDKKIKKIEEEKVALAKSEQKHKEEFLSSKRNIADLRTALDDREKVIGKLNSDLHQAESSNEGLSSECEMLEGHIAEITGELKLYAEHNQESLGSINGLNEKLTVLSGEVLDVKYEKETLEGEIKDLKSDIESERIKYEGLEGELQSAQSDLDVVKKKEADFVDARQEWADTKETFEMRLKDFSIEIEDRDEELLRKQTIIDDGAESYRVLSTDFEKAKGEKKSVGQVNMTLEKEKSQLAEKYEKVAFTKKKLEVELKDRTDEVSVLTVKINGLEKKEFDLECEVKDLEKKVFDSGATSKEVRTSIQSELDSANTQRHDMQMRFKEGQNEILSLKDSLQGLKKELQQVRDDKAEYISKVETFQQDVKYVKVSKKEATKGQKELDSRLQDFDKKEADFQKEVEKRREELNLYSRWVDSQKESLKKHIVRFSQELKLSTTVNPLNSYLSMTGKELEKVQLLLSKPGIVGAQRTYLEEHCEMLTEQKKYVQELVVKNKDDVERRAGEVIGLLKQSEFIPVPPLPPKK